MGKYPHYKQLEEKDCGPACIKMICKYYGKFYSIRHIHELAHTNRSGSNLLGLSRACNQLRLKATGVRVNFQTLAEDIQLPCIAHWQHSHFVVVYHIGKGKVTVGDPAHGVITYTYNEFQRGWNGKGQGGIALVIEPTADFFNERADQTKDEKHNNWGFLLKYVVMHKKYFLQIIFGLLISSFFQMLFPFLTKNIVDVGIAGKDISFIYLVLGAQLALFLGRAVIDVIRSWTLIYISARINISLISEYFMKLMNLPIAFFDKRLTGDLTQRINDHNRIEQFLTSSILNMMLSLFTLVVMGVVLCIYSVPIFTIFFIGSALYLGWILVFLKRRAEIDYKRFSQQSHNQSKIFEIINGMQEIKLNNAEQSKRWEWEKIQIKLYKISMSSLSLAQVQNVGSGLINELKNILITVFSAGLVIKGELTLGMMLSVTYIVGQLNGPVMQILGFIQTMQDAGISLERLKEIHNREDEEKDQIIPSISTGRDAIHLQNVSFSYDATMSKPVFTNLNLHIPANKITAIVGSSGSGKTTLLKLLLKFYSPEEGEIRVGDQQLERVSAQQWRARCGVVMQEGYIFNDTIARNIALGVEEIDHDLLEYAIRIANIQDMVASLPLGVDTMIGQEGQGLSTGQKQRVLIARAVYKEPEFIFFDEATSALDANNEKKIIENLQSFFKGKTVVIIAHRLSTVKNADQIVVIEEGKIIETGNHETLVSQRKNYFELIKNQLALGN